MYTSFFPYVLAGSCFSGFQVQNLYHASMDRFLSCEPGSKDANGLLRCKVAPAILKHSESADLLRKSLLPHVLAGRKLQKVLSCKHERLFVTFDP